MATCFFIGHRDVPDSILDQLSVEVERHITIYGVTDFIVGSYGWFDSLAAKMVKAAKKRHPEVTLTLLLSYHPYDRPIPTPDGYDGTFYPPSMETVPKRVAIVRANRYMVDHSEYLIAYYGIQPVTRRSWWSMRRDEKRAALSKLQDWQKNSWETYDKDRRNCNGNYIF